MTKEIMQQALDALETVTDYTPFASSQCTAAINALREAIAQPVDPKLPVVGYYGVNHRGYESISLKENHLLRDFEAGEITAQPVCLISDAIEAIAAIAQPVPLATVKDADVIAACKACSLWATGEVMKDMRRALEGFAASRAIAQPVQPAGQLCEDGLGLGQVMWFNKPPDGSMLYASSPIVQPVQPVQPAVQAERERCAKVCDDEAASMGGVAAGPFVTDFGKHTHQSMAAGAMNCASAIRQGGEA